MRRIGFREAWLIALFVKLSLAILVPLSLDESYYWVWGQYPQLSYFDHPPMVGWLFYIGRFFEFIGGSSARIPGVLIGHCTLLVWNSLLKNYLSESQRKLWLLFVVASPMIGWGSLIQTPDVSFVFLWSVSILAVTRALETRNFKWYLLLGISLGLGFCAKYPTVLFVPALLVYLAFERKFRTVHWAYALCTVVVGLVFCSPVLLWNYQHEWASFKFQLGHGLDGGGLKKSSWWPVKYSVEQFFFLFPTVVIFAFRSRIPRELNFLKYFGWFPVVFFFLTSFKARVEPNWPVAAYPAILTLAFFSLKDSPWLKRTVAFWLCVFALIVVEVFVPFVPVEPSKLKTNEPRKYNAFLPVVKDLDPLFGCSYQMASQISFKLKRTVPKLQGMSRPDFYDFLPLARPNSDKFFVMIEGDEQLPEWAVKEGFVVHQTTPINDRFKVIEVRRRAEATGS